MNTKATVVYHSGDFDGIFCREIARKFLSPQVEQLVLIGWDYKDPKLEFPAEGKVYVLDLNPECFKQIPGIDEAKERMIWIDHHVTAIAKWGTYLPGFRIDGVAACRLAWHWFTARDYDETPSKDMFLNRQVSEPLAVRLAGEYDIWDHRGDGDLELQLGLKSVGEQGPNWDLLLSGGKTETLPSGNVQWRQGGDAYVAELITAGKVVQAYVKDQAAIKCQDAFLLRWRGLTFLALNDASKGSLVFESRDVPATGHDALMRFYWTGKAWEFSLYHAKHRTDIDLSTIAAAHGGGGHKGACGFRTTQIPFPLYPEK